MLAIHFQPNHRLVGLAVKASASRVAGPRFTSRLWWGWAGGWGGGGEGVGGGGLLPDRVIKVTFLLMALQWLPCQAHGVIGSALGLVGLVSVYCERVRQKVRSATSVSVWQVAETLSKQPTNKTSKQPNGLDHRVERRPCREREVWSLLPRRVTFVA